MWQSTSVAPRSVLVCTNTPRGSSALRTMSKTEYKIPCQKSQGRPMARGKDPNVKQLTSERRILTMTKERQNNGRSCDPAVLVQTNMLGCEDATRRNCSKLRDLSGLVFRLVFSWIAKIA